MKASDLTVGSLFSGIGGIDLGLERAGFTVRWQVEIDGYASRVLAKHWPAVQRYRDVRDVGAGNLASVDLVAGGFPCQDISGAGKRAGIEGKRSGLWSEMARVVGELRPRYVLVENVAALRGRGLGRVLGDLATLGYDAEWECLPAAAFGAPHIRDRIFILAYPNVLGTERGHRLAEPTPGARESEESERQRVWCATGHGGKNVADSECSQGCERYHAPLFGGWESPAQLVGLGCGGEPVADAQGIDQELRTPASERQGRLASSGIEGANPDRQGLAVGDWSIYPRGTQPAPEYSDWWSVEPDVGRVAYGVPSRVDRITGLGNAVVPQIAEWIGRQIIAAEATA